MNIIVPAVSKSLWKRADDSKSSGIKMLEGDLSMPTAQAKAAPKSPHNVKGHEELIRLDKQKGAMLGSSCYLCIEYLSTTQKSLQLEVTLSHPNVPDQKIKSDKGSGEYANAPYFEMIAQVANEQAASVTIMFGKKIGHLKLGLGELLNKGAKGQELFAVGDGKVSISWFIDGGVGISKPAVLEALPPLRLVTERTHYAPGETLRVYVSYSARSKKKKVTSWRIKVIGGVTVAGHNGTAFPGPMFEKISDIYGLCPPNRWYDVLPGIHAYVLEYQLPAELPPSGGFWRNQQGLLVQYAVEVELLRPDKREYLCKEIFVHRRPLLGIAPEPFVKRYQFDKGAVRAEVTAELIDFKASVGGEVSVRVEVDSPQPVAVSAQLVMSIAGKPFNQALMSILGSKGHFNHGRYHRGYDGIPILIHQELNRETYLVGKRTACPNKQTVPIKVEAPKEMAKFVGEAPTSLASLELGVTEEAFVGVRWCVRVYVKCGHEEHAIDMPVVVQEPASELHALLELEHDFDHILDMVAYDIPQPRCVSVDRQIVSKVMDRVEGDVEMMQKVSALSDVAYGFDGRVLHCSGTNHYTGGSCTTSFRFNTPGHMPMLYLCGVAWPQGSYYYAENHKIQEGGEDTPK